MVAVATPGPRQSAGVSGYGLVMLRRAGLGEVRRLWAGARMARGGEDRSAWIGTPSLARSGPAGSTTSHARSNQRSRNTCEHSPPQGLCTPLETPGTLRRWRTICSTSPTETDNRPRCFSRRRCGGSVATSGIATRLPRRSRPDLPANPRGRVHRSRRVRDSGPRLDTVGGRGLSRRFAERSVAVSCRGVGPRCADGYRRGADRPDSVEPARPGERRGRLPDGRRSDSR